MPSSLSQMVSFLLPCRCRLVFVSIMSKPIIRMSQRLLNVPGSGIRDAIWLDTKQSEINVLVSSYALGRGCSFSFTFLFLQHVSVCSPRVFVKLEPLILNFVLCEVMTKSAALKAAGKDVINWHIGILVVSP